MQDFMQQSRRYGAKVLDESGNVIELHGLVKIGDVVEWLGRKAGSGLNDNQFVVGKKYAVCFIYDNGDVELQGDEPQITTRAGPTEYRVKEIVRR